MKDEPECPEGCIKSIEELKDLLVQAKLEPIEFYIAGYAKGERKPIKARILNSESKIFGCELSYKEMYSDKFQEMEITGLPAVGGGRKKSNLRFFLNYWHAYAYSLRFKEKVDV